MSQRFFSNRIAAYLSISLLTVTLHIQELAAQEKVSDFSAGHYGTDGSVTIVGGDEVVMSYSNMRSIGTRPIYAEAFDLEGQRFPGSIPGFPGEQVSEGGSGDSNQRSKVASNAAGKIVFAWESPADGGGTDIMVRSFSGILNPAWSEVRVNDPDQTDNQTASVGIDAAGKITVVWRARVEGQVRILGRHVSAAGATTGSVFEVPSAEIGEVVQPVMAMDDSGRFQVLWIESDNEKVAVVLRSFGAGGTSGSLVTVHEEEKQGQSFRDPDLQASGNGNYVAGWARQAWNQTLNTVAYDLLAKRLSSSGQSVSSTITVVSEDPNVYSVKVAADDAGKWAASWSMSPGDGTYGIRAQRYDASGVAIGGELEGSAMTTTRIGNGDADMSPAGDLVVLGTRGSSWQGSPRVEGRIFSVVENNPPVAVADEISTFENNEAVFNLLENDSDEDGHALSLLDFTQPSHGLLESLGNGVVSYFPEAGYAGVDTFTYRVQDSFGAVATGSVMMTVVEAPAPIFISGARNGSLGMRGDGSFLIAQTRTPPDADGAPAAHVAAFLQGFEAGTAPVSVPERTSFEVSFPAYASDVAIGPNGHAALVWHIDGGANLDAIYLRMFLPDGTPVGEPILVNDNDTRFNRIPRVAVDGSGNAVVAWNGQHSGTGSLTLVRCFSANGTAMSGEEVFGPVAGGQLADFANVGVGANGEVLVVWDQQSATFENSVKARRVNEDGSPGPVWDISRGTRPSLAMNEHGAYVIAWKEEATNGQVKARIYNALDQLVKEVMVSASVTNSRFPHNPATAISSGGNFVVAWDELHLGAGSGGQRDVLFREFNGAGDSLSGPTLLNAAGRESGFPEPAMDDEGNFVIVWQDAVQDSEEGIKGRWYASSAPTVPQEVDFDEWIAQFIADPDSPAARPDADPDGDNVINRDEFAFAGNPTDPGNRGNLPRATVADGSRVIRYGRVKDAALSYIVQYSFGLDDWTDGVIGRDYSQSLLAIVGTDREEVSVTLSDELTERGVVFVRIRLSE
ncbi:MAG: Ig-like domain-containing protein [Akkermansiaceae bacterium]